MKHILSDWDMSPDQVKIILETSAKIKSNKKNYSKALEGKTLIMLFELASLRTRISFEAGMTQLGGHAIMYGVENQGFSRSETLKDGVAVLSRYSDIIMARVLKQEAMDEMGAAATVPVINGMTEKYHPCQNLADLLTIYEKKGELNGLKIAYIGDGACNTAASTIIGCAGQGMNVTIVCPDYPEYSTSPELVEKANKVFKGSVEGTHSLDDVVNADVIYTDVWVSAGMEEEKKKRMKIFPAYQVNKAMVDKAKPDCIVMHCLPAKRGMEITSAVMDSDQSVVLDQAENRMHAQKGLMYWLLKQ
ncbi:ornithine carbamoyltransferase [Candidatus Bathyarchaeota archaeon]|nr:MAG: ornithine carbamoyltransferase [Candidatus Bathyarchaeota archaeon]